MEREIEKERERERERERESGWSTAFDAAVGRPLVMQQLVERFLMQRWVDRF